MSLSCPALLIVINHTVALIVVERKQFFYLDVIFFFVTLIILSVLFARRFRQGYPFLLKIIASLFVLMNIKYFQILVYSF